MPRRKPDRALCAECATARSDMNCPVSEPLDRLLEEFADQGYQGYFNGDLVSV